MLTFGFYDSQNHDRTYSAQQFSSIFDGIIRDGIFATIGEQLTVKADGTGMVVKVSPGRAWFNHTWTLNDAPLPLTIEAADFVLNRKDLVILEVNETLDVRANSIKILKGVPATSAVAPTLTNNEFVHQYILAEISIVANATKITQADITSRVGTGDTPFVTGILQTINIDNIVAQWTDQWGNFMVAKKDEFRAWFEGLASTLDGNVATNLLNKINQNLSRIETNEAPLKRNTISRRVYVSDGETDSNRYDFTVDEFDTFYEGSTDDSYRGDKFSFVPSHNMTADGPVELFNKGTKLGDVKEVNQAGEYVDPKKSSIKKNKLTTVYWDNTKNFFVLAPAGAFNVGDEIFVKNLDGVDFDFFIKKFEQVSSRTIGLLKSDNWIYFETGFRVHKKTLERQQMMGFEKLQTSFHNRFRQGHYGDDCNEVYVTDDFILFAKKTSNGIDLVLSTTSSSRTIHSGIVSYLYNRSFNDDLVFIFERNASNNYEHKIITYRLSTGKKIKECRAPKNLITNSFGDGYISVCDYASDLKKVLSDDGNIFMYISYFASGSSWSTGYYGVIQYSYKDNTVKSGTPSASTSEFGGYLNPIIHKDRFIVLNSFYTNHELRSKAMFFNYNKDSASNFYFVKNTSFEYSISNIYTSIISLDDYIYIVSHRGLYKFDENLALVTTNTLGSVDSAPLMLFADRDNKDIVLIFSRYRVIKFSLSMFKILKDINYGGKLPSDSNFSESGRLQYFSLDPDDQNKFFLYTTSNSTNSYNISLFTDSIRIKEE